MTPNNAAPPVRTKMQREMFRPFPASIVIMISGVIVSLMTSGQALAQTDADFSAYCRDRFPNSAYQRIAQSSGNRHVCNQGGTHQGIDLAEACRLTTGSRTYEETGTRVICGGKADSAAAANARDVGSLNVTSYCRTAFPNSFYEPRYDPTGFEHYCRQPGATGGFTLHKVDLAAACQAQKNVSGFRKTGVQVICISEGDNQTAGSRSGGAGGGGAGGGGSSTPTSNKFAAKPRVLTQADIDRVRNREFPPLEPEDIIDAEGSGDLTEKPVRFANLKDCGGGDPKALAISAADLMRRYSNADGLDGMGWAALGISTPCPGITNGFVADLMDYCRSLSSPDVEWQLRRTPSGRRYCWRLSRSPDEETSTVTPAEIGGGADFACLKALRGKGRFPTSQKDYKDLAVLYKYAVGDDKVECFYMKRCRLMGILDIGEPCKWPKIRFMIATDRGFEAVDVLPFLVPIYVEMEIEEDTGQDIRTVAVKAAGDEITLSMEKKGPGKLYSSKPFLLEPDGHSPVVQP